MTSILQLCELYCMTALSHDNNRFSKHELKIYLLQESPGLTSINQKCLSYNSIHRKCLSYNSIQHMYKKNNHTFFMQFQKIIEKRFELVSAAI